jgi:hypothetical protein
MIQVSSSKTASLAFGKTAQQSVPDDRRDNAPDAGDCPEGVRTSQAVS